MSFVTTERRLISYNIWRLHGESTCDLTMAAQLIEEDMQQGSHDALLRWTPRNRPLQTGLICHTPCYHQMQAANNVPFLPPHPLVIFVVLTYAFCFHLEVGMLLPVSSANQGSKSQQIWSTRLSVAGFELLSNFKLWGAVVRSSWHLILSSPIPAIIHAAQSWSHEDRSKMMNHSTRQLWV